MKRKEIVVVEAMPPENAKKAYVEWATANPDIVNKLDSESLIVDYIRGPKGKTFCRYRIFVVEEDLNNVNAK